MNWRKLIQRSIRSIYNRDRHAKEAGAAMFQGLRIRLTLWYCAVLGMALLLFGMALYLGTQYFLLAPIEADAATHAQMRANNWLRSPSDQSSPAFGPPDQFGPPPPAPIAQRFFAPEVTVYFDQHGSLQLDENTPQLPSALLTNTLAKLALQTGQPATDIVNAGGTVGSIYRYALAVPSMSGSGFIGVIVVGESIQAQETALSLLLVLLLTVGGLALLSAGLGGLFLANRALAPARLAWENQQRFIADASHELRTPLTLLRADAEVLLRGRERLEAEDVVLLEDIVAEVSHMGYLATNLLTLARLDTEMVHREHEVIGITELVQRIARRVRTIAEEHGITVIVESSDNPYVIGDPMLLEQALLVLLDNAIKYNREGGLVTIRIVVQDEQVRLEIEDTGIGIAAEHLPHLGERFYRVDKARSREAGGTGLGLSIARNIALVHGGQLALSSVPEQGTTVTLILPLVQPGVNTIRVQ